MKRNGTRNFYKAGMFFSVYALSALFAALPLAAQVVPVTGTIQSIQPAEDGTYEITIASENGTESYKVTPMTLVETILPASRIQAGQKIIVPGAGGGGGFKGTQGIKDPFGGMSKQAKDALGLPDIPNVPEIPAIPDTENIPSPEELQEIKEQSEQAKAEAAQAGGPSPAGMAGGGRQPGPEAPEQPPAAEMFGPEVPALSSASGGAAGASAGRTVVDASQTEEGVRVRFDAKEGEEEVLFSPDQKVRQILSAQDLEANMRVMLVAAGENTAALITVL